MEPTKITSWHMADGGINYRIFHFNEDSYYIGVSKEKAGSLLLELFGEDSFQFKGSVKVKTWYLLRPLWKIGIVKTSAFAKSIIDAALENVISLPIAAIVLSVLEEATGEERFSFLTERLIGIKRLRFWKDCLYKYQVSMVDPVYYAICNMLENDDEDIKTFIEINHKKINDIIDFCGY